MTHLSRAVILLLVVHSLSTAGASASAKEATDYSEAMYVNWWGPYWVNRRDWKRVAIEDVDNIGLNEVSVYPPETEPTQEQIKAADDLLISTFAAAMRHNWYDFEQAGKDGFVLYDRVHYINQEFVDDGRTLDPDRPETLMYYPTEDGMKLVGVMYLMPTNAQHGPQVGGPLTLWHFHVAGVPHCWWGYPDFVRNQDGSCLRKTAERRSPEMLHVWLIDHPDGPFASEMTLPQEAREALQCMAPPF